MEENKKSHTHRFSAEFVRPRRRLLSAIGDIFAFYIISAMVFLAIFPITKALPSFKNALNSQRQSLDICENIYIDGHLVFEVDEDTYLSNEETVSKFINIKLDSEDYDEHGDYKDFFYYFYISYANGNLTKDGVALSYDENFMKNDIYQLSNQGEVAIWDDASAGVIHLTEQAKTLINQYISNNITAENKPYYDKIHNFAKTNLVEAEKVIKSSDVFKSNYATVMRQNEIIYYHLSISSTVTYVLLFFLYFLLAPFLLKNGQTFTKKILQIKLVDKNNQPIKFKALLIRSILQFVSYSFIVLFIPYLILGKAIFNLPMITVAGATINLFVFAIVTFVLSLVSFIVCCSNESKQALIDKIVDVYALDMRNLYPVEEKDVEELE